MAARNSPSRKAHFRRIIAGSLIFFFSFNPVFGVSNLLADLLATAGVRVAPPREIAVEQGYNLAEVSWLASPHAVSGSIDSYRIYFKPSSVDHYSDCPPSSTDEANDLGCSVEYSFATDPDEEFNLLIENMEPGTYDFIVRATSSLLDSDLAESSIDCDSCEVQNIEIIGWSLEPEPVVVTRSHRTVPEEPIVEPEPEEPEPEPESEVEDTEPESEELESEVEEIESELEEESELGLVEEETESEAEESETEPEEEPEFEIIFEELEPDPIFSDIDSEDWAYDFILNLKSRGIVVGYSDGTFRPGSEINRAELTKIALLAFRPYLSLSNDFSFSDVSVDAWFSPFVSTAQDLQIVNGYSDGLFRPSQSVSRAEAVKILTLAAGFEVDPEAKSEFIDVSDSDWFGSFMAFAEQKGITTGYPKEIPAFYFSNELEIGSRGGEVGVLQFLLSELGYYKESISFVFNEFTKAALFDFQLASLEAGSFQIGVLDEITQAKLYEITEVDRDRMVREFRPNQPISRAEITKIVSILLDIKEKGFSLDAALATTFDDPPLFDLSEIEFETAFVETSVNPDQTEQTQDESSRDEIQTQTVKREPAVFSPNSIFENLKSIFSN